MSAFICNPAHVRYLVTAARRWTDDKRGVDEIGQILVNENHRAVNFRYSTDDAPPVYRHRQTDLPLTAVQVLKAIHCLQYQLAEPDDYRATQAWEILEPLAGAAIKRLPGYEKASWEIRP